MGEVEHVKEVHGFPEASTDHDLPKDGWAVVEFPKDRPQTIVCCLQDIISSNTGQHPKV